jgi:hypothetical protein
VVTSRIVGPKLNPSGTSSIPPSVAKLVSTYERCQQ